MIDKAFQLEVDAYVRAAGNGNFVAVREFLNKHGNEHVNDYSSDFIKNALANACMYNQIEMVTFLVQQGADIHRITLPTWSDLEENELWSPLMYCASANSLECLDFLISQGADINAKAGGGYPVSVAAFNGSAATLRRLLDLGADFEVVDDEGETPRMAANWVSYTRRAPIIEMLEQEPQRRVELKAKEKKKAVERAGQSCHDGLPYPVKAVKRITFDRYGKKA